MNKNRIIYSLSCPVTGDIHYIGKSKNGLIRPKNHLSKSHSKKISEWVENLSLFGKSPVIKILEYVDENLDILDREKYWISKTIEEGGVLLNQNLVHPININPNIIAETLDAPYDLIKHISRFVKDRRKLSNLTQEEFSEKLCVALTVVRKIEQGKENVSFRSIMTVIGAFGATFKIVSTKSME